MGNYCTLLENCIYKEFIHLHVISYQLLHNSPHQIRTNILQSAPPLDLQSFYDPNMYLEATAAIQLHYKPPNTQSSATSFQLKQNEFPPLSRDIPQLLTPVPLSKCRPSTMYPTIPKLLPSSKQSSSVLKPSSKVNILKHVLKPPATPLTSKQAPLQNSKPPTSSRDSKDTRACSCPHCDKTYAYSSGLSKHIRKEHGKESKGKGYLSCNLCPFR